jgi:hypothetical protein
MKKLLSSLGVPLVLAFGISAPALAAVQTNIFIPFAATIFNPCLGEPVALTGTLHVLVIMQQTGNGTRFLSHAQPQGIEGTGLVSGASYRGTGVTMMSVFIDLPPPFDMTSVNNFRIIGAGDANNYMVHTTMHITVNANDEVTANVANTNVSCQP